MLSRIGINQSLPPSEWYEGNLRKRGIKSLRDNTTDRSPPLTSGVTPHPKADS